MAKLDLRKLGNAYKGIAALARELNLKSYPNKDAGEAIYHIRAVLTGFGIVVDHPTAGFLMRPWEMRDTVASFIEGQNNYRASDLFLFDLVCASVACHLQECRLTR